jgi:DNA-binding CsgD family transcriptional regulator
MARRRNNRAHCHDAGQLIKLTALPLGAEMEQRVCELAAAGHYDDEIARILTGTARTASTR